LLSLENVDEQLFVFKELEKKSLSVRQLEQIVAQLKRKKQLHKKPSIASSTCRTSRHE
jgi:hypothetical protein